MIGEGGEKEMKKVFVISFLLLVCGLWFNSLLAQEKIKPGTIRLGWRPKPSTLPEEKKK